MRQHACEKVLAGLAVDRLILALLTLPDVHAVYADGGICLDILQNQWSPIYDVSAILTSIRVRHLPQRTVPSFSMNARHSIHEADMDAFVSAVAALRSKPQLSS